MLVDLLHHFFVYWMYVCTWLGQGEFVKRPLTDFQEIPMGYVYNDKGENGISSCWLHAVVYQGIALDV